MHQEEQHQESTPSRIVMVDDHPLYRFAIRQTLAEQPDLELVGEATDGLDAVELCRRLRPALVLMDVRMPKMDGFEATRAIKGEFPDTIVLILTALEDPNHLAKAIRVGAGGYILKDECASQIISAIRKVLAGEDAFDQAVATQLLTRLLEQIHKEDPLEFVSTEPPESSPLESLTPREFDVLQLMARGQSNQQIAQNLFVSVHTVKKHVCHILVRLGVSDRMQAVMCYLQAGAPAERNGAQSPTYTLPLTSRTSFGGESEGL